jgi:hypothetical protein
MRTFRHHPRSAIALLTLAALGGCGGGSSADAISTMASIKQSLADAQTICIAKVSMARGVSPDRVAATMPVHDRMSIFMVSVRDLLAELGAAAQPTIVAVKSGNWGDATTWGGRVPVAGDVVQVPGPFTVTVDGVYRYPATPAGDQGALKAIIVSKGATLAFQPAVNTEIVVDTLFNDRGTLQIGTQDQRIAAKVTAVIQFPNADPMFPTSIDPRRITRGIISDGILTMYGGHKSAWKTLAADAQAQATSLALEDAPNGWQDNDKLVLASTNFNLDFHPAQNEVITLASNVAGSTVSLTSPIHFDHVRPVIPAAATAPGVIPMQIHVANLTRNIVIASASKTVARRGHVMQMTNNVHIHAVLFQDLGRTDKTIPIADPTLDASGQIVPGANPRARYAFHLHEAGADAKAITNGPEATIRDSVMSGSPGWGFVNHGSYAKFAHNVAFDFVGAGFVTEDGDEAGEFIGNIAIGGRATGNGPGDLPGSNPAAAPESMKAFREVFGNQPRLMIGDMGFGGHGFWLQGPDIVMRNNIAAGNKGAGFVTWSDGKFDPATGGYTSFPADRVSANAAYKPHRYPDGSVVINDVPLREFSGNQAYGNFIGMKTRFTNGHGGVPMDVTLPGILAREKTPDGGAVLAPSLISNLTVWANRIGIVSSYTMMNYEHVLNVGEGARVTGQYDPLYQPALGIFIRGPRTLEFRDVRIANYPRGGYISEANGAPVPEAQSPGISLF